MVVCKFYSNGFCSRGEQCRFEHVDPAGSAGLTLNATATAFTPGVQAFRPSHASNNIRPLCRFFARGYCQDGDSCQFGHPNPSSALSQSLPKSSKLQINSTKERKLQDLDDVTARLSTTEEKNIFRNFGEAQVTFAAGAEVMAINIDSKTLSNHVQAPSLSCFWYKPSRVAWLHYESLSTAKAAADFLNSKILNERQLQCELQKPGQFRPNMVYSVQIGNLSVSTKSPDIRHFLRGKLLPEEIVMGKLSYSLNTTAAENSVRNALEGKGKLDSWEPNGSISSTKVKAVARYQNANDARDAVRTLHQSKIPALGNSRIFVNLIQSVKFLILTQVLSALGEDLADLKRHAWSTSHVQIKTYPPEMGKASTVLRIYGEDAQSVAKTKSSLERLLEGVVASHKCQPIWHQFVTGPQGLLFLKALIDKHGGFVYRDLRKSKLRLYGSPPQQEELHKSLIEKVKSLLRQEFQITLDHETLSMALKGGFQRIVLKLGKEPAKLNITKNPKTITILGSEQDRDTAYRLLNERNGQDETFANGNDADDCAVCWTPAEHPLMTDCGHIYCKDCFASQCVSAPDTSLPVRCQGDAGACQKVFGLVMLERGLQSNTMEALLEGSFKAYVRSHQKEFQYCPTPDCPQIYRTSAEAGLFTCPACLVAICTGCQNTSHEGLTCAQFRAIAHEGNEEFAQWKRENDVRDCPSCQTPIEKTYGCNHMECRACGSHICWYCMACFASGPKTYGHIQKEHQSFV